MRTLLFFGLEQKVSFDRYLLSMLLIFSPAVLTPLSYKYDSRSFKNYIYVRCEERIKKIEWKITAGNVVIRGTFFCQSNEKKSYNFIYPIFSTKIQLMYRIGTHIYVKTKYLGALSHLHETRHDGLLKSYYRINFLFNYLSGMFIITLMYFLIKVFLVFKIRPIRVIVVVLIFALVLSFFSFDVYYIVNPASGHSFAYKVFGGTRSEYDFKSNEIYIYPVFGHLSFDFNRQLIKINTTRNVFIIYACKKKVLVVWKNFKLW